jgi:hypothetical protein
VGPLTFIAHKVKVHVLRKVFVYKGLDYVLMTVYFIVSGKLQIVPSFQLGPDLGQELRALVVIFLVS